MDHGSYKALASHPGRNFPSNGEPSSCCDDTNDDQNTAASPDAPGHVSGWYQAEDDKIRRWTPGWWLGMFFIFLVGILTTIGNQVVSTLLEAKAVTRDDCEGISLWILIGMPRRFNTDRLVSYIGVRGNVFHA